MRQSLTNKGLFSSPVKSLQAASTARPEIETQECGKSLGDERAHIVIRHSRVPAPTANPQCPKPCSLSDPGKTEPVGMHGRAGVASSGPGPVDGVRPYHGLILGHSSCCFRTGVSSGAWTGALNLYPRGLACLPVISQVPSGPCRSNQILPQVPANATRLGDAMAKLSPDCLQCPETLRRCAKQ